MCIMKSYQRKMQVSFNILLIITDSSEEDLENEKRTTRPKCNICHNYKYTKDIQLRHITKNERELYLHICTKIPCTKFSSCPSKWLAVIYFLKMINFLETSQSQEKTKRREKKRKNKKKERIGSRKR